MGRVLCSLRGHDWVDGMVDGACDSGAPIGHPLLVFAMRGSVNACLAHGSSAAAVLAGRRHPTFWLPVSSG
jgi:hypothetical protein